MWLRPAAAPTGKGQTLRVAFKFPSLKFVTGTTFGCLLTLLAFNTAMNYAFPEGMPAYRDMTNVLMTKLPGMLRAQEKPDVLLLGASGIVIPSVRCDDEFHHRESRYGEKFMKSDIWKYAKSDYLASLLSSRLHKSVTIDNTGSGGCVMSDQYLVLKKWLEAGKKPEYVLITTGPKDFFDNLKPNVEKTPIYTELADFPLRVADVVQGNTKLDTSVPEMSESLMRAASKYYFFRDDYRSFLAKQTSDVTNHPESLEKAAQTMSAKPSTEAQPATKSSNVEADKAHYIPNVAQDVRRFTKIYLPINRSQFDKQMQYLQRTIDLAKSNNIAVQICFMPLVDQHTAILKPDAWNLYKNSVREVAAKAHVTCLDPQEEIGFSQPEFEDSAHLNSVGGKKLFAYLADKICDDPKVALALSNRGVLIGQHY